MNDSIEKCDFIWDLHWICVQCGNDNKVFFAGDKRPYEGQTYTEPCAMCRLESIQSPIKIKGPVE